MHALTFTPAVPSVFRARVQRRERCVAPRAQRSFVVRADGEEIDPDEVMLDMEERMEKSIDSIRTNFNTVRTGRANAAILDRVEVEYYGAMTPLKSIANATTPDAQTILIQPFDKGAINDIERALMMSDLGLTPGNDGNAIRLNIPSLTAEPEERTREAGLEARARTARWPSERPPGRAEVHREAGGRRRGRNQILRGPDRKAHGRDGQASRRPHQDQGGGAVQGLR
jgi:hypothetical protein